MLVKNEIVAVIAAKKESKGIPGKNVERLGKHPMFWRTVVAALDSIVDKIIVASDDTYIVEYVNEFSKQYEPRLTTFDRPDWLSLDVVQVDTVAHITMLRYVMSEGHIPRTTMVLQPTSPFRNAAHINDAIKLFRVPAPPHVDFQPSVMSMNAPDKFAYRMNDLFAKPVFHDPLLRLGRDEYDTDELIALENGAIYIVDTQQLFKHKTFRVPPIVPYLMKPTESLEIDTEEDMKLAKLIAEYS
jgi:CMP-N-acetylneuraminic acid synthetase